MKSAKQKPTRASKSPAGKSAGASGASSGVDWAEINRVLDFMSAYGLEEFEYGNCDLRIRLKRPGVLPALTHAPAGAARPSAAGSAAPTARPDASGAASAPHEAAGEDLHTIKSPIVGTYYSAPNPESAPFVKIGDQVKAGQVLCIIEAMKLMNEIESDVSGEIAKIFPESGHPVEYGEPLFAIRTKK